jgi:hypothetical protein
MQPGIPTVNVYIDGYNFYRPIQQKAEQTRDHRILHLAWCDYWALASRLAQRCFGDHRIGAVKLFTAYARDDVRRMLSPQGLQRKEIWLEALHLAASGPIHISFGRWELKPHDPQHPKEKLTDVKLAISLVRDGLLGRGSKALQVSHDCAHAYEDDDPACPFDKAIVISCDKDFLPAVEMVEKETKKAVMVCFPYLSTPYRLPPGCSIRALEIKEGDLQACSLPDEIPRKDGSRITWYEYVLSKGWPTRRTAK